MSKVSSYLADLIVGSLISVRSSETSSKLLSGYVTSRCHHSRRSSQNSHSSLTSHWTSPPPSSFEMAVESKDGFPECWRVRPLWRGSAADGLQQCLRDVSAVQSGTLSAATCLLMLLFDSECSQQVPPKRRLPPYRVTAFPVSSVSAFCIPN
jgi:hypothetical protein